MVITLCTYCCIRPKFSPRNSIKLLETNWSNLLDMVKNVKTLRNAADKEAVFLLQNLGAGDGRGSPRLVIVDF